MGSPERLEQLQANLNRMHYLKRQTLPGKIRFAVDRLQGQSRLFRHKPALGWNILGFWLHHKVSRTPRLRTVDLMVTGRCNFRCSHCYAAAWTERELVPLPTLEKALDELRALGVFHFILQGGEPLVDLPRLRAIVPMCQPRRSYINVVTNGWLVTPALVKELGALGVSKIAVSVDSGIPEEHDRFRNQEGSWRRATEALAMVRAAGLQTGISTTVSHQSLHSEGMKRLFGYAQEKGYRVNINPANLSGRWEASQDVLLSEEDSEHLLEMHVGCSSDRHAMSLVGRDLFLHHGLVGCPAVKEQVSISASGDVFPCVFVHIALGNIRDQSIRSMVQEALKNEFFGRWNDRCLGGEDREFIAKYVEPYLGAPKPLNGRQVFGLEGLCRGCRYEQGEVS